MQSEKNKNPARERSTLLRRIWENKKKQQTLTNDWRKSSSYTTALGCLFGGELKINKLPLLSSMCRECEPQQKLKRGTHKKSKRQSSSSFLSLSHFHPSGNMWMCVYILQMIRKWKMIARDLLCNMNKNIGNGIWFSFFFLCFPPPTSITKSLLTLEKERNLVTRFLNYMARASWITSGIH